LGKATTSIEIEASPEKVFDFVISEKMNDLTKEFYECKWTSTGPVGVGSTAHYVGVHKRNRREEWNAKATEFVKNKNLTMHLTGANKRSHDETLIYMFEPTVKGTKMTLTMEYGMPYSVLGKLIDGLLVKNWVEKENNKVMENLKKALEA